jgi:tRNA-specific 2-thiouridylase
MRTPEGKYIAQHHGLMYYTLGQRQGLGIGGVKDAPDEPWFVLEKDLDNNVLIVGQGHDHPLMLHNTLEAGQLDWCGSQPLTETLRCAAKTRYRQPDQDCIVEQLDGGLRVKVRFDEHQRAITPGQSVVFYANEICLGGGIIESKYNS